MFVTETERQIEVLDSVDVLVAGGGVAGCAAAVAAARAGADTMLIERNGCLGGILTTNIIPNLDNHYRDIDGRPLLYGIGREIIERLVARGACVKDWDKPYAKIVLDEQQLKVVLIEITQQAGVKVLTHIMATRPIMKAEAIQGVFIESRVGRQAVLAKTVVDSTGEADIASQTGCPMRPTAGTSTLVFKMANVDMEALYLHFKEHPESFPGGHDQIRGFPDFEKNWEYGSLYIPHRGGRVWDILQDAIEKGEYSKRRGKIFGLDLICLNGLRERGVVSVNTMLYRLQSLDPFEVSEAELESQETCYYVADFLRTHVPGFEKAHVVQISQDLAIRVSRGIEGETTLTERELTSSEPVYFDDVIAVRSAKYREIDGTVDHPFDNDVGAKAKRSFQDMTASGEIYYPHTVDIPFRITLPKKIDNLLVGSGKTVSCMPHHLIREGSDSMRVGQAAGVAAALSAKQGNTPRALDIRTLQRTLLGQGVYLGADDRLRELGLL